MAVNKDGNQAFGISTPTFSGFIVESYNKTDTSERRDLNDGDGEPLGSATIPGREEFTATVQVGNGNTTPTVGAEITYGSDTLIIQTVATV